MSCLVRSSHLLSLQVCTGVHKCTRAAHRGGGVGGCLFCSFRLVGVCKILGISIKSAGRCLEYLQSRVDIRLCDLRLCSENLGEEETL